MVEKVTAFLIVRNEQLLLPRCLDSLTGVVAEVVVLDTGSNDGTVAILEAAAADPTPPSLHWQRHRFRDFGSARQAALDLVRTEWALWIDADEVVTPALQARLCSLRASGELATCDGWEIGLENRVYGRVMRARCLVGQYRLSLFRTRRARYSDSLVHEGVQLAPPSRVGRIEEPLRHDTLVSWRHYLAKVNLYTDLETRCTAKRFNPLHLLVTGPATLWREYIGRRCYRDGWPGLVWALLTAWGSILRDLKLLRNTWRRSRGAGSGDSFTS
ncbi:MAG: glycosyltransferase family 2 protein [bacterium]